LAIAKRQLGIMGVLYDWDREVTTCDPSYYRWTQELFLLFFERGLAHRMMSPVNWCPVDKTVLATSRSSTAGAGDTLTSRFEKRDLEQWFPAHHGVCRQLLDDLAELEHWPEKVRVMQANWIGRSHGVEVEFPIDGHPGESMRIYTTRPDNPVRCHLHGPAPRAPLGREADRGVATDGCPRGRRGGAQGARDRPDLKRGATAWRIHRGPRDQPVNGEKVPIWVGDYVLITYGTGAIMAVPAHDQARLRIAQQFGLPDPRGDRIRRVRPQRELESAYTGPA